MARKGTQTWRRRALVVPIAALALLGACSSETKTALPPGSMPQGTVGENPGTLPPDSATCGTLGPIDGEPPAGLGPGDLVSSEELTSESQSLPGFPNGGRVWRVLYVSTGVDERDLDIVCGTVTVPAKGVTADGGNAHLLAWAHGTVGLAQACMPSNTPNKSLWGTMPAGINAPGFADPGGIYKGDPANGALQYAVDQGWVVAATDYRPDDTYVIGKVAAANVLDSARAAAQLVVQERVGSAPQRYDMITWGHSQGGHAALWAGQLAEPYLKNTKPSRPTAPISLAGVVALAPASTFTAEPGANGHGLADWEMHKTIEVLGLPIPKLEIAIGPALFSYIFGSWAEYSGNPAPAADAKFPAYPRGAAALDPNAVLTPQGQGTVTTVTPMCLETDGAKVQAAVNPYINAQLNQMLTPKLWNLPDDYKTGQFFYGGLDQTCRSATEPKLQAWCSWITWNLPGPRGTNPFPKVPQHDGQPVPVMIGQGMDDTVIHCQPAAGANTAIVPDAADCMSKALFDDLSTVYCPEGAPAQNLTLDLVRHDGLGSPATHQSIPGQLSSESWNFTGSKMTFTGSRVQSFMVGAFGKTLTPGCTATVVNP